MKLLVFTIVLTQLSYTLAQTGIIAHKSHSGTNNDFDPTMNSNFGEPPNFDVYRIDPKYLIVKEDFKRLNDSTIIYSRINQEDSVIAIDTLAHEKNVPDSILKTSYSWLKNDLNTPIPVVEHPKNKKTKKSSLIWISLLASLGFIVSKAFLDKSNRTRTKTE